VGILTKAFTLYIIVVQNCDSSMTMCVIIVYCECVCIFYSAPCCCQLPNMYEYICDIFLIANMVFVCWSCKPCNKWRDYRTYTYFSGWFDHSFGICGVQRRNRNYVAH